MAWFRGTAWETETPWWRMGVVQRLDGALQFAVPVWPARGSVLAGYPGDVTQLALGRGSGIHLAPTTDDFGEEGGEAAAQPEALQSSLGFLGVPVSRKAEVEVTNA